MAPSPPTSLGLCPPLLTALGATWQVRAEWLPLLFVGKHEPRTQKETADAPTEVQRQERGKLAAMWLEAYDEAGITPSVLGLHLPEVLPLLTTIVHGPSWALRRAAAYGLLEIGDKVSKTMVSADQGKVMGALAARLVEKRWRDKEHGEQAAQIGELARAHGFAPKEEDKEEEESVTAGVKRPMEPAEEEADSADI